MSSPTKSFRGKHFELPGFANSVVTKVNPGLREAVTDSRAGDFVNRRKAKGSVNRPDERFRPLHLNPWSFVLSVVKLPPSLRPSAHRGRFALPTEDAGQTPLDSSFTNPQGVREPQMRER